MISVLLYGSETWKMTKEDDHKVDTFVHKCLRRILHIFWPMRVTNEEVRRRANIELTSDVIRTRRWRWIGHILRSSPGSNQRTALTWTPADGRRRRGKPKETWRRTVERERARLGFNTWGAAGAAAHDRAGWRSLISGPTVHRDYRT